MTLDAPSMMSPFIFFVLFQMQAKIVFSRLLQTFKIKLPDSYELVVVQRGIVQTKDDVICVLERRY